MSASVGGGWQSRYFSIRLNQFYFHRKKEDAPHKSFDLRYRLKYQVGAIMRASVKHSLPLLPNIHHSCIASHFSPLHCLPVSTLPYICLPYQALHKGSPEFQLIVEDKTYKFHYQLAFAFLTHSHSLILYPVIPLFLTLLNSYLLTFLPSYPVILL
jgi:hypothetical protein